MVLREHLDGVDRRDVRILATDISHRMLEKAGRGVYAREATDEVALPAYRKYFIPMGRSGEVRVAPEVRSLVHFAYLNLLEPWPMKGRFQVIFCRNVMIYFDRPTQQELINRFYGVLDEGGYLFVGHSEGLSAITHRFHYVRPAVYRK
jgi:chemotaxis protein methyltransferase CheR